jgi:hypothetical protein
MSKRERIEYLESEVAGLHARIAELIAKVEGLEKRKSGWVFNTSIPLFPQRNLCPWCHKEPANQWHYCPNYPSHWVDPNQQWTCIVTTNTEVLK